LLLFDCFVKLVRIQEDFKIILGVIVPPGETTIALMRSYLKSSGTVLWKTALTAAGCVQVAVYVPTSTFNLSP
jgi:hypothetical protein